MKSKIKVTDAFIGSLPNEMQEGIAEAVKNAETDEVMLHRRPSTKGKFTISKDDERTAINFASTRSVDRDNEIVVPGGVDLKVFKTSPVLLWGHNWSEPPIGSDKSIGIDKTGFGILAKSELADTPRGNDIFALLKGEHLRTSSIGFMTTEFVRNGSPQFGVLVDKFVKEWAELTKKAAAKLSGFITKSILLEHSLVSIPANAEALVIAVSEKSIDITAKTLIEMGVEVKVDSEDDDPFAEFYNAEVKFYEGAEVEFDEELQLWVPRKDLKELDNSESLNKIEETEGDKSPKLVVRLIKRAEPTRAPTKKDLEDMVARAVAKRKDQQSGKV